MRIIRRASASLSTSMASSMHPSPLVVALLTCHSTSGPQRDAAASAQQPLSSQTSSAPASKSRREPLHLFRSIVKLPARLRRMALGIHWYLTTSPQTRRYQKETTNVRTQHQLDRDQVHRLTDFFHLAGKGEHRFDFSVDERTLENGLHWSFVLPVAVFFVVVFLLVSGFESLRGRSKALAFAEIELKKKYERDEAELDRREQEHRQLMKEFEDSHAEASQSASGQG